MNNFSFYQNFHNLDPDPDTKYFKITVDETLPRDTPLESEPRVLYTFLELKKLMDAEHTWFKASGKKVTMYAFKHDAIIPPTKLGLGWERGGYTKPIFIYVTN